MENIFHAGDVLSMIYDYYWKEIKNIFSTPKLKNTVQLIMRLGSIQLKVTEDLLHYKFLIYIKFIKGRFINDRTCFYEAKKYFENIWKEKLE